VPLEEFLEKLHAALEARTDPDFVIMARTDAWGMVGGSLKETIRRCQAFVEAGADVIVPMVRNAEEMKVLVQEIPDVPIMGVHIVLHHLAPLFVAVEAVMDYYQKYKETGEVERTPWRDIQMKVQELIGLPEYYKVEEATTEKRWQ